MGMICEWSCPACEAMWQLREGHGMNHALLNTVAEEFPPEMREEILAAAAGEKWPVFHFNFRPARCGECHNLVAAPWIQFPKTGKSWTGSCPVCDAMVKCDEEDDEVICPRCGQEELEYEEIGHWD